MSERTDRELDELLAFELVPPPLDPRIERELAAITPVATRRPRRQLVLVLVGASLVVSAMLAVLGLRADLHQLPAGWIPVVGALWVLGLVLIGVTVVENPENPGYYSANFYLRPHFQLEGMDIGMSLVSRLPAPKS